MIKTATPGQRLFSSVCDKFCGTMNPKDLIDATNQLICNESAYLDFL